MLTLEEYADQQRSLGRRVHEHDGVFWEAAYPFYCKPAFAFQIIERGAARPGRFRSVLGYSHQVPRAEQGNRSLNLMLLARDRLDGFDLSRLPSKRRNIVRRAIEQCEIRPVEDLERWLERIREINVSQAVRQEQGFGSETPVRRYTHEAESWRAQMRREFTLRGREWWGAFVGGDLAAYLRTYQVEGTRVIHQTKADTACLKHHPVDALYFSVLSMSAADAACRLIVNGDVRHASLTHFKREFLFEPVSCPCFSANAWLVELGKGVAGRRVRIPRPGPPVERGGGEAAAAREE